ncbi:MAG: EamA family transporter, partial [Acidobacteriaceae bacterium]
ANGGGLLWPLAASRVGSLALALGGGLLFSRGKFTVKTKEEPLSPRVENPGLGRWKNNQAIWKVGILLTLISSTCDTGGNFFFVAATRVGRLDVAAMLSSLYPASTILLAAWLLKERTSPRQALGMAAALVAVALIS